jgi:hypothetical protein
MKENELGTKSNSESKTKGVRACPRAPPNTARRGFFPPMAKRERERKGKKKGKKNNEARLTIQNRPILLRRPRRPLK